MAAATKVFSFVDRLCNAAFNFGHAGTGDTLKVALYTAAAAPTTSDTAYAATLAVSSAVEVGSGNGYTTAGNSVTSQAANSSGTSTINATGALPTWTASSAGFAFRYLLLYDSTSGSKYAMFFYDYGSTLTLSGSNGDTFQGTGYDTSIFTIS